MKRYWRWIVVAIFVWLAVFGTRTPNPNYRQCDSQTQQLGGC